MFRAVSLSFLSLALLAGCASLPTEHPRSIVEYEYDPNQSLALNVARAAGIEGIQDLPYEDYVALVEENPELATEASGTVRQGARANLAVTAGASAVNYISPPTGLSPGAAGLLGAISWFAGAEMVPARENWFIAWLPEGMTVYDLENIYLDALLALSPLSDLPLTRTVFEESSADPRPFYHTEDCELTRWARKDVFEPDCSLGMIYSQYWLVPGPSFLWASRFPFPDARPAPTFVDVETEATHGPIMFGVIARGLGEASELDDQGVLELSAQLPSWVYIYYARSFGKNLDRFAPVVLNQGEVHYFVEPPPAL